MVDKAFGDAGRTVLIEEKLEGREVSVLALVDGSTVLVLPACRDHKRLRDNDEGPNTGGMGAFCPSSDLSDDVLSEIERDALVGIIDALRRDGAEFRGVLYAGIMLTPAGPKVLEYNVRFGDPECQPLLARLTSDPLDLLVRTAGGTLLAAEPTWDDRTAVTVVLAAHGYPDKPRKGDVVTGIERAEAIPGVTVQHAGTARNKSGEIVTAGGRVLNVTALGDTLQDARDLAYRAVDQIHFKGMVLRRDIAASVAAV
jgi:phosphoribosylamine--glycine ligase